MTGGFGALVCATVLVLGACSAFGDDADDDTASATELVPELSVTVPSERLTPFCQAMIDLADELATDPPDDAEARILEVYEGIVDDVPSEIRDDFLVVLARLQAGPEATAVVTTLPPSTTPSASVPTSSVAGSSLPGVTEPIAADEGYLPDDDPTLRLNTHIQATCRGTNNNPGPPPTQPNPSLPDE